MVAGRSIEHDGVMSAPRCSVRTLGLLVLLGPQSASGAQPGATLAAGTAEPAVPGASSSGSASAWGDRTLAGNTLVLPATFPSAFVLNPAGIEAYGRLLNGPNRAGP